ncbi:MAG: S8 family serine peptidase [Pyrinomonadaceae bacterium]|nr:S8 family serine peptidase [Pyrinomonadaceae bacterium]
MRAKSHVSTFRYILSLTTLWSLVFSTLAPFTLSRADAAPDNERAVSAGIKELQKKGGKRAGELLVRFRANALNEEKTSVAESKGASRSKILRGDSRIEKLKLQEGQDVDALAAELRMHPSVEFAEPNYLVEKNEVTPDDPRFADQWALKNTGSTGGQTGADINAPVAWQTTTGSPSTVVAVIDSGIDFSHPDLKNNQWKNPQERANNRDDDRDGFTDDLSGWDWVTDSGAIRDEQGHGTIVAGIIAAQGNNQTGTAGVMWRASLMSLRVLDNTGTGDIADAVEAIDYAVAHGAQVINCSWGTDEESAFLKDAIERAGRKGVVVVTSAGNESRNLESSPYYPASFRLSNLIAVASTDQFDRLASFSNYGSAIVQVAAPGTEILTTQMGGGYRSVTGSSASAPLVAGVAGLVKTLRPSLTAAATRAAILDGARRVDSLAGYVSTGAVVSAEGAMAALHGPGIPLPGNGNDGGNSAGVNGAGNQEPPSLPPPGKGTGGNGKDGGFSVDPPTQTTGAPGPGLPNLDGLRKAQNSAPQPAGKIRANLPCTDCDPYGGGGGSGYYPSGDPLFSTPRTRPQNDTGQPGVDLGSRNYNWRLSLLSLPGRAGLDLNLTLHYNSLVWMREGSFIKYNADHGTPGPGFHLGMPFIQQRYLNSEVGVYAYMMVMPSGGSVEMRQVGASNVYESADSSYFQMIDNGTSALVRDKAGTQYSFSSVNSELRCTQIKDRNGNYISVEYDGNGHITRITDTLGRQVNFNYGADQNLSSITQSWGGGTTHTWATFNYGQLYMQPSFSGLYINGPNNSYQTVLTSVVLDDGSYYTFDYTTFGQIWKFTKYSPNNQALNVTAYNVSGSYYTPVSAQTDCPRFTEKHDWALNWNNNNEVVTTYSVASDGSYTQVTMPDGTIYKEYFATTGWQKGLSTKAEVYSAGSSTPKKTTETLWTQDDPNAAYKINPRAYDIKIYDDAGNVRRTTMDYTSYGLPTNVREYAADGQTVLRRTETQYRFDNEFTSRHIYGVVWMKLVYEVQGGTQEKLVSKLNFHHDWDYWNPAEYSNGQAPSVGHDAANYGSPFFGRANVTGVYRYNLDAPDDPNQAVLIKRTGYNLAGEPFIVKDVLGHSTQISYADSFSDNINSRGTLAYPTTVTDEDGYASTVQYHYETGLVTRTIDPKGATFTMQYDAAGRIERVTNQFNNSYTRYVYSPDGMTVEQLSTLQAGGGESHDFTILDGAGRVRATGSDMPGSAGGYRAQFFIYDIMGRVSQQSNPTEINGGWTPTGDDSAWVWTTRTYDWKGRPLVTTNADGSTVENSYAGCGCAGGEQVTTRDERGRRKRLTMDVLGRLKQVDELNWNQTVYSTTTYTYNGLDQLTGINQAGQTRTFEYDAHGRLWRQTTPEQGTTTYAYNLDDTINYVDDARGVRQSFGYNNRHLVTSISYSQVAGVVQASNVAFAYDAVGNRTSMTDGLGTVTYNYNTISQLTSETRSLNGVNYTLTYGYELGGQLASITNPWGAQVAYQYDRMGRVTGVTGAGYVGVSSYAGNLLYRAMGGLKALTYGNNRQLSIQYDGRLRVSRWDVSNVLGYNYSYNNFSENTGRVTYAQNLYDSTLDRSYDYDHVGRLSSAHTGLEARWHIGQQPYSGIDGPYSQDRGYDVFGNVTHRVGWGGWQGSGVDEWLTYNSKNQLVTNPANGAAMQYDAAGNLINDGYQTYSYDSTGQQRSASLTGLVQDYDGDGLRVKKTEQGATTYYLRSSLLGGQVIAEITGAGVWQRGYVYLGSQLLAIQYAGGVHWVHQDPIAKSQRITDSSGALESWIELDPWGGEITGRSANTVFQPHKYTTYERDNNGGDEAMFRRYEGRWNRFAQPDPYDGSYSLTDPQSFNRYAYVQNDPVNLTDPTGLDGLMDAPHWTDFCFSAAYSGCGGGQQMMAFAMEFGMMMTFGDAYWDLPGYANEAARGMFLYEMGRQYIPRNAEYIGNLNWAWSYYDEENDVFRNYIYTFSLDRLKDIIYYYGEFGWLKSGIFTDVYGRKSGGGLDMHPAIDPVWIAAGFAAGGMLGGARGGAGGAGEGAVEGAVEGGARTPARIYSARVLIRSTVDRFHDWPQSFDRLIFQGQRTVISDSYILYTRPGAINGVQGVFEIGVRPSASGATEVIVHRFFRPIR